MHQRDALGFGPFQLDLENEQLRQEGRAIHLRPKSFAVLRYLAEHPRRLITKDELLEAVWPGIVVSESVLTVCLSELRKALGRPGAQPAIHRDGTPAGVSLHRHDRPTGARGECSPRAGHPLRPCGPWWAGEMELARLRLVGGSPARRATGGIRDRGARHRQVDRGGRLRGRGRGSGRDVDRAGAMHRTLRRGRALSVGPGRPGAAVPRSGGRARQAILHQYAPTWLAQMPWFLGADEQAALGRSVLGSTRERMLRELAEAVEACAASAPCSWSSKICTGAMEPRSISSPGSPGAVSRQGCCSSARIARRTCSWAGIPWGRSDGVGEAAVLRGAGGEPAHRRGRHPLFVGAASPKWPRTRLSGAGLSDSRAHGWSSAVHGHAGGPSGAARMASGRRRARWVQAAIAEVERELPDSLRQMIEQQLQALPEDDQRVLEAASVAGIESSAAAVAAGLATGVAAAEGRVRPWRGRERFLLRSGVETWPDGTVADRYRFRHVLHQQVVYERIPEGSRIELHQRIGRQLEEGYGPAARERAAELAGISSGGGTIRAVRYRRQAADNALQRCAYREAVEHLTTALTILASLPETPDRERAELALLTTLGPALIATRGHAAPDVEHVYVRARELCRRLQATPQLFRVLRGMSMLYLNRAELGRVRELAEERLRLAQQEHDPVLLLGAHDALGAILYHLGELALARAHLEHGLALSRNTGAIRGRIQDAATDHGVACLGHLAWALWLLGYPGQARQRSQEAIARAQELAHPFSLTQALYWGAQLHQFCQDARGYAGAGAGGHGDRHRAGLCPATGAGVLAAWLGAGQAGASKRGHRPDA